MIDNAIQNARNGHDTSTDDTNGVNAKLTILSQSMQQLAEQLIVVQKAQEAAKHPTTTAPTISNSDIAALSDRQARQQNLIMTNIPLNVDAPDGGKAEAEKFFADTFHIQSENGLIDEIEPIGDPERHMVKLRFKNPWKRSQILRTAATKLAKLKDEAPPGRKPTVKPDYSFREREERRKLGDEVKAKPGGFEKYTIRRGKIVERNPGPPPNVQESTD